MQWLSPLFGGELRLAPDLDQVSALAPERAELWKRIGEAAFLSDDEKRIAVGYGARQHELKFDPDQPRVPAGNPDGGQWTDVGGSEGAAESEWAGFEGVTSAAENGDIGGGEGQGINDPRVLSDVDNEDEFILGEQYAVRRRVPARLLAGATIRNKELAGKRHPVTNVPFDKDGFPDFSEFAVKTVKFPHTGIPGIDFTLADHLAGFKERPKDMTWHHHQDGRTMQLVLRNCIVRRAIQVQSESEIYLDGDADVSCHAGRANANLTGGD